MSGAWSGREIDDGEAVHPDGICSSQAMTSMKPIRADNNILNQFRLPHLNARIYPEIVEDDEGYLRHIDFHKAQVSRELSLLLLVHLDVHKLHSSLPLQVNKKAVIKDFTTIFTILEN